MHRLFPVLALALALGAPWYAPLIQAAATHLGLETTTTEQPAPPPPPDSSTDDSACSWDPLGGCGSR
jgi:hypothetical protein